MESTVQILTKLYQSSDVIHLIANQIQELPFATQIKLIRKFICLSFSLPSKCDNYSFKIQTKNISFIIVLGKGYPYNPPRVHIKTGVISPGFDDCRDLLYQILDIQQWDYKITLKHIQQKTVTFLSNLKQKQDIFYVSRIGQFHLNFVYPVQLIKEIRDGQIVFVFQYDSSNVLKMYIADISATHLVLFLTKQQPQFDGSTYKIPHQNQVTSCMITFYAELGAITEMTVDRQNFNNVELKFTSKKPHNMHMTTTTITKKLKLRKGISFIKKIIKNMSFYSLTDITVELNPDRIQKQQKQFLAKISEAQKQLQHKFNSQTIKSLNKSYQNMVEYYSSHDSPYFEIYIEKITKLYERPDVQLIMDAENNENQIKQKINIPEQNTILAKQNIQININSEAP